ncbi:MAG: hypothetical protein ACKOWR_06430 [Micrococcales bacterium]
MELQDLFDDLESKFVGKRYEWDQQVNCIKLQTIDLQFVDLLTPIIGVDFVAGLDNQHADWLCFSNQIVANCTPRNLDDSELPLLRQQEITMVDFVKTLNRPVRVAVKFLNLTEASFNLLEADERYLIAESGQIIPLQSIYQLRVLGTNSWP